MRHDLVLALRDLAVLASGLVVGGQMVFLFAVFPGLRNLSALEGLHFHQAVLSTDLPDRFIQPAGIVSMAAGVALLALGPGSGADAVLEAVGIAGIVGIVVTTRRVNRRINRLVGTWTDEQAGEYALQRDRWHRAHRLRTSLGMVSFVAYIVLASH